MFRGIRLDKGYWRTTEHGGGTLLYILNYQQATSETSITFRHVIIITDPTPLGLHGHISGTRVLRT